MKKEHMMSYIKELPFVDVYDAKKNNAFSGVWTIL